MFARELSAYHAIVTVSTLLEILAVAVPDRKSLDRFGFNPS